MMKIIPETENVLGMSVVIIVAFLFGMAIGGAIGSAKATDNGYLKGYKDCLINHVVESKP